MLSLMRVGVATALFMTLMALPVLAAEVDPFPNRYASFDIKVAWNAVQTGPALVVSGLIKNVRYVQIEDIDVTVSLLDNEERVVATGGALPIPIVLKSYDSESFSAPLKGAVLRQGNKLQFMIRYRVNEGGTDNYSWMTSFTVDAASGTVLGQPPPKMK